jgi:protein-S-isoprenylcysteine O-methyltransferase
MPSVVNLSGDELQHDDSGMSKQSSAPGWRPGRAAGNNSAAATKPSTITGLEPSNHYAPEGKKSLAGISLRAFLLGVTLGISSSVTLLCLILSIRLWRLPFFVTSLCLFHFLEFYITARYNTEHASTSAFLLSSNGWAYNAAHGSAIAECVLSHLLFPEGYSPWLSLIGSLKLQLAVGLLLMVVGQIVRTLAMVQAGGNFNHTVQVVHREGHTLVTNGVYGVLRHPSYFGFFWWGLGTQLILENMICFWAYAIVLWRFFASRIESELSYCPPCILPRRTRSASVGALPDSLVAIGEERLLIRFFGDDYVYYRRSTWVGIPGMS